VVPAVVAVAVTASVAIRRRYPASVGAAAAALVSLELGVWGDPQVIATSIAYLCALYGLTVWTPARRFVLGAALIVIVNLAPAAGPKGQLGNSVTLTVVTLAVMLLVRGVLRARERPAQLAGRYGHPAAPAA